MPGAVTNKSVVCVHGDACAAWDLGSNHMVLYLPEMTCMVSAQILTLTGMTKFELTPFESASVHTKFIDGYRPHENECRVITRVLQSKLSKMNNNTIWIPVNMMNGQTDQKAESDIKIVAPPPSPNKQQVETKRPQNDDKFKDPWTPTAKPMKWPPTQPTPIAALMTLTNGVSMDNPTISPVKPTIRQVAVLPIKPGDTAHFKVIKAHIETETTLPKL